MSFKPARSITRSPFMRLSPLPLLVCASLASAQIPQTPQTPPIAAMPDAKAGPLGWQSCQALTGDAPAQLKCFQDWADAQTAKSKPPAALAIAPALAPALAATPALAAAPAPTVAAKKIPPILQALSPNTEAPDGKPIGCRNDSYSALSRFWELQRGSDCDTFALRGYRPISLAVVTSDSVNMQPSSPSAGHTALTSQVYSRKETKIQLSVRTKLATGLLTKGNEDDDNHDSLWFGYTQQSYWQLFNGSLSRPFRATDHEPEVIYIYPHQIPLAGGWNYRLSGLGLVHQSNGQSLPLSRSWNRVYVMGAAEKTLGPDSSLSLQGRVWQRLQETPNNDDNPGIENYIGRAELTGNWQISKTNTLGVTVRHSLRSEARGSTRIDWMMAPASSPAYTGLRYHIQLFSGYGDSLLDYNRKRNVLSVGLSLVDW